MRAAAHRAARRVGRRGAVLTLKGIMALLYGYGLLVQPIQDTRGVRLLLQLMPLQAWAWTWVAAGSVAIVCAWLRPGRDWPGFAAIYLIVSPWSLAYLTSWWLYGNPRGWAAAVIWAAFGGVAAICAAWPEPLHDRGGADER